MDLQATAPHPHTAAHHGLASIAIAGIFLLMALPTFQLALWLEVTGYKGWSDSDKRLAAYGGYIGAGVIELLCLTGIGFGIRGAATAERTGEPSVLCTTGVVLCLFTAAVWLMVGVAWHSQAAGFIK